MKVVLFDLTNHRALQHISQQLRNTNFNIHDVQVIMEHLPTGNHNSAVDQIWYIGTVVTKLADMFSGQMIKSDTEFIFDTTLTFLNTSVTILSNDQGIHTTVTDFRELL
jgi:DNA-binding transcriptional MerR regulator